MIGAKIIHTKMMSLEIDGHNVGNLVDESRILNYWGDIATEVMIRATGNGSLFRAFKDVEFIQHIHVGDFVEFRAWLEKRGNSSFEVHFEAYKTISKTDDFKLSHGWVLPEDYEPDLKGYEGSILYEEPILCATGVGVLIVKKENQKEAPDIRFRAQA